RLQVRCLAVAGDRYVGRCDVDRDEELRLDRRLRDGVRKPAAEGVNVTLVAGGMDFAGDWCAVHADEQLRVGCPYELSGEGLDDEGNLRHRGDGAKFNDAGVHGVAAVGDAVGPGRAEPLRGDRLGMTSRGL